MSLRSMSSTQGTLLEEDKSAISGPSTDLQKLGLHLSVLAPKTTRSTHNFGSNPAGEDIYSLRRPESPASKGSPRTESEIIVRLDDMDYDMDSPVTGQASQEGSESYLAISTPVTPALVGFPRGVRQSNTSSASVLSDHSQLSSLRSSPSSKATTPVNIVKIEPQDDVASRLQLDLNWSATDHSPATTPSKTGSSRHTFDVRPRVSIPTDINPYDYANQCVAAAEHSRLNPYALHQEEYLMFRNHISHAQVTTYLNIRNGILRLWLNNPRIGVTREEAVGCAKDPRWFDAADTCYDWLLRRGYINYGCAEVQASSGPKTGRSRKPGIKRKRKTVVVIGAGMAGLGCARQLEALFKQYSKKFQDCNEHPPRVIVLEGRSRLGGRVYSRALDGSQSQRLIEFKGKRHSVECGGMIITGFERGNPLNVLVRGQLALPYHILRSDTDLFDSNGKLVDVERDRLVEKLYNDCLERVSEYKYKIPPSKLIEGNKDLMDEGKDSASETHKSIADVEEATAALPQAPPVSEQSLGPQLNLVPVATDKASGTVRVEPGSGATLKAADKAKLMGWALKKGVTEENDLKLDEHAKMPETTLGSLMEEAISQYGDLIDLTPQDYRLLNWHIANLEYSNATNLQQLSLGGWDIDAGNEWEGKHTMVVGGYQNVPVGLAQSPSKLDVRKASTVTKIVYDPEGKDVTKVECDDGTAYDADYVVSTIPLGVLKHGNVDFDPPLPPWKTGAIERLGFGILNKIILVYEEAFWDTKRDIFGVLRSPESRNSIRQNDYVSPRGRCFQWFNVSNTSGIPVLIGLMAGDAGFDAEKASNNELVAEATEVLRSVYGWKVPYPVHAVVTRWGSDKFARGSYSSAGPRMKADDYDMMARPVGNLFFAGEHTTGTHPATVHGAYLSGLRAASEVIDTMLGPIEIPVPLIVPKESSAPSSNAPKRKAPGSETPISPRASKQARIEAHETAAYQYITSQIGDRPWRPQKVAGNAYLLYSKTNFEIARKRCEETRRPGKGKPGPNDVRVMTSKMWKEAGPEERKPFEEQAADQKRGFNERVKEWEARALEWDQKAIVIRKKWEEDGNRLPLATEDSNGAANESESSRERRGRGKTIGTYTEREESDIEVEEEK